MNSDSYTKGFSFEIFVRRAHKCDRGMRNGADVSFVRNLIDSENGASHVSHLPKFDKLLAEVKKYLIKAIDKFLSRKPTTIEKDELTRLRYQAENAFSSSQIVDIVEKGLDVTRRYRDL